MNEQEQRIAIAKVCGWMQSRSSMWDGWWYQKGKRTYQPLTPDYLNDLNAMHDAEKRLEAEDNHAYECYCSDLYYEHENTVSLTANQRAEAFLRTVGKWAIN